MAHGLTSGDIGRVLVLFLLLSSLAQASGLAMYERATRLIGDRYLRVDEFEADSALTDAAEAAEAAIPWLIVDVADRQIVLKRGDTGATDTLELDASSAGISLQTLPDQLEQLEVAILGLGEDIPEGVDLPVELLRGLSRSLDRHSVVMHRGKLDRFDERIKGKLVGIGARIGLEDGEMVVKEVFDGTPAHEGGLSEGDRVVRVDGISTNCMSVRQTVERIRGPVRTRVRLQVRRMGTADEESLLKLAFTRAEVKIPNVSWRIDEHGVGIITIDHFSEQTVRLCRSALEELSAAGESLVGIVLDLRGNTGGSMIQSADTADLFLTDGVIVKTAGRGGKPVPNLIRMIRAHPADVMPFEPDVPIVILQNKRSASASEILAGALTSLQRAVIIGRTSHGKGTVQKLYMLRGGEDRVRLKLTVAEYYLAGDVPVHGAGLSPDLTVRRVVYNRSGAWIPPDLDETVVLDVDERQGWREEGSFDRDADPLLALGGAIVRNASGASRQASLDAIDRMATQVREDADARVMEAFRARSLDWSPADEEPEVMEASVALRFEGAVRSGERVRVVADINNLGIAPLYRVRARLQTDSSRRPWNGVTIPVGFLPPQEQGTGVVSVSIPIGASTREDLVRVTLEADGLDPLEMEAVPVRVEGREVPPVGVLARLVPHEDHHRVEVELTNQGGENLTGVRARFAWQEDSGLELLDREARVPVLAPGVMQRADLALRVLDSGAAELPLQLRLEAEQFQEVLRAPIVLPLDGTDVSVARPIIQTDVPTRVPSGDVKVGIVAGEDTALESLSVWWQGEKVAYGVGDGPRLRMSLELPIEEGSHRLRIIARDEDGNRTRRTHYVRGLPGDDSGNNKAE